MEFLDAHQGSAHYPEPEPEFMMSLPPVTHFRDLHAGMKDTIPHFTEERLSDYLGQFHKKLEIKEKELYYERWLQYVRVAEFHESIYVHSKIWAELRKTRSYSVDVSLNHDGVVQEAQCECGVGQGPEGHCKHIAAVLFGLSLFCQTGDILTELTCTQVLQTFHKSTASKGSPVKSSSFQAIRGKPSLIYDPRPEHLRITEQHADHFRGACLNFPGKVGQTMPVMQLFTPANIPALCHDHDYMALSPEEQYLRDNHISEISESDIAVIERETRGQGKSRKWKETRLQRITSSNFGTVCKATESKNMVALAKSMTVHRDINTKAIMHGKKFERVAVEKFESIDGIKTEECGLFICQKYPQLAASPDRLVGEDTVLEVKCPFSCKNETITPVTVPYLKNIEGVLTLDNQHCYYYQVQGQLLCTNRNHCKFVVYTIKDIVILDIARDELFIQEMTDKLIAFYDNHFKAAVIDTFLYKNYKDYKFR